jgi:hypothetical protein
MIFSLRLGTWITGQFGINQLIFDLVLINALIVSDSRIVGHSEVYPWSISGGQLDRCCEILFARNIKGAHFAVGFDRLHHHLPKGAPL